MPMKREPGVLLLVAQAFLPVHAKKAQAGMPVPPKPGEELQSPTLPALASIAECSDAQNRRWAFGELHDRFEAGRLAKDFILDPAGQPQHEGRVAENLLGLGRRGSFGGPGKRGTRGHGSLRAVSGWLVNELGKAACVPGGDESARFLPNRLETPGNKAILGRVCSPESSGKDAGRCNSFHLRERLQSAPEEDAYNPLALPAGSRLRKENHAFCMRSVHSSMSLPMLLNP